MNNEGNPLNVHIDVTVEGGDPQSLDFTINPEVGIVPEVVAEDEPGVNIDSALSVLANAEAAKASGNEVDMEEVNEKIKALQDLQNNGIKDPAIQNTLVKLIAVRG